MSRTRARSSGSAAWCSDPLAGHGMAETQPRGVQELAAQQSAGFAVHRVAQQRVAQVGQVHADLVGSAGFEVED